MRNISRQLPSASPSAEFLCRLPSRLHTALFATATLGVLAFQGCSVLKAKTDPSKFYVLQTLAADPEVKVVADRSDLAIELMPVRLPDYLERKQIVVRDSGNSVSIHEFERWAEDPDRAAGRVLGENLALLLNNTGIGNAAEMQKSPDYRLEVVFFQMDGDLTQGARVTALWRITDGASGEKRAGRRTTLTSPMPTGQTDYDGYVSSISAGLAQLSREIATAIAAL